MIYPCTTFGMLCCSLEYSSTPECLELSCDHGLDVGAVGVVMYIPNRPYFSVHRGVFARTYQVFFRRCFAQITDDRHETQPTCGEHNATCTTLSPNSSSRQPLVRHCHSTAAAGSPTCAWRILAILRQVAFVKNCHLPSDHTASLCCCCCCLCSLIIDYGRKFRDR